MLMETKDNKELRVYIQPEMEIVTIETGSILQSSVLEPGSGDTF